MKNDRAVPVFKLYGETSIWPTPDLLHIESVAERSSLHHWHIPPHQHVELVQLLFLKSGRVEIEVEGRLSVLDRHMLQVIPSFCIHGFRFSRDVQGYVLSLALPMLEKLEVRLEGHMLRSPECFVLMENEVVEAESTFRQIYSEYGRYETGRDLMLSEIKELLMQNAIYCGFPAANGAFHLAGSLWSELGAESLAEE